MAQRDMTQHIYPAQSLDIATYTAATNGQASVDLKGYEGALCIFVIKSATGTFTFEVKESDDNTTFTPVADSDFVQGQLGGGTNPNELEPSSANGVNRIVTLGYIGRKQFLRIDLPTVGTTGVMGGFVLRGFPRQRAAVV